MVYVPPSNLRLRQRDLQYWSEQWWPWRVPRRSAFSRYTLRLTPAPGGSRPLYRPHGQKVLVRLLECSPPGASPWHYQGDTMKKTPKKLVLAKETLRDLERENLGLVVGALDLSAPTNCALMKQRASCEFC